VSVTFFVWIILYCMDCTFGEEYRNASSKNRTEKLLEHLENERGYAVEEKQGGIYTIKGDILPVQIIDSRQLTAGENIWLKSLNNRLDASAFSRISEEIYRLGKAARIAAYADVLVRANIGTVEEVIKMSDVPLSLEQVFEEVGWIAKWEAKGEENGALKIAKNMINRGYPFEEIVSATQLDPEKVEYLYQ